MSVLIRFAPASLTAQQYAEAIRRLDDDAPDGREFHVCFGTDGNLRVSEIWDSREQFAAFGRSSPKSGSTLVSQNSSRSTRSQAGSAQPRFIAAAAP